jgi:tRNA A37 methylthiotransferase MiaB
VIVGFPGETTAATRQTLSLLDEVTYDGIFSQVFAAAQYSRFVPG